ncbi:MAG: ribbon-helix-helix domain-containing protein [Nanoarchaeota archaeon]|nr:ribbon-helix-helix domain-containing protein [Nanoarchaeota archaeon]
MAETTQINVRLPDQVLTTASQYAKKHGFGNVQELIKESLREKLFGETMITKEELLLVKKLAQLSEKENLFGTEEELFRKLKR